MKGCYGCPGRVPIVSVRFGLKVALGVPPMFQQRAVEAAVRWLTEQHPGLTMYEGVQGRGYTPEEKVLIAQETGAVARLGCPFAFRHPNGVGACLLGGCAEPVEWEAEIHAPAPYAALPTILLRALKSKHLIYLTEKRQIADAKLAQLTRREDLPVPERSYDGMHLTTRQLVAPSGAPLRPS